MNLGEDYVQSDLLSQDSSKGREKKGIYIRALSKVGVIIMIDCFLMLGGNIGDTFHILTQTIQAIHRLEGVHSLSSSRPYLTDPISPIPQDRYINSALHFKTALSPKILFSKLEEIERGMGKKKKEKFEPRPIDIDLIFYGNVVMQDVNLTLPHPHWQERLFVLYPLADLVGLVLPPHPSVVPYPKKLPFQLERYA